MNKPKQCKCPECKRPLRACWIMPCFHLDNLLASQDPAKINAWLEKIDAPIRVELRDAAAARAEHPVEMWEDIDGLAYVDGQRVLGGYSSKGVVVTRSYLASCQLCKQANIKVPLVLMRRFELALGRTMYWFGPNGRRAPAWCTACSKLRNHGDRS